MVEDSFKYVLKQDSTMDKTCTLPELGNEVYTKSIRKQLNIPDKTWAEQMQVMNMNDDNPETSDESESSGSEYKSDADSDINESAPSITVEVPKAMMKHVIGIKGRTINQIKKKTNTNMRSIAWKVRGEEVEGFLIQGKLSDLEKGKEVINKMVTAFNDGKTDSGSSVKSTSKAESRPLCRFFKNGACNSGTYCGFSHDLKNKRKSKKSDGTHSSKKSKKHKK